MKYSTYPDIDEVNKASKKQLEKWIKELPEPGNNKIVLGKRLYEFAKKKDSQILKQIKERLKQCDM